MADVDLSTELRAPSVTGAADTLRGLWVPLVTPLSCEDGRLDEGSLARLVDHVIDGGADGLFLWGTTSEAASLGVQVGRRVITAVMHHVASCRPGGFPSVVCVSDPCFEVSVEMAQYAARFRDAGVIGVAATPPYYYLADDQELRCYFEALSLASPLPVILYNFPHLAKTPLRAELVAELAALPGIAGLKDSSGDATALAAILERVGDREDFSVLAGDEKTLVASLQGGAKGGVCGTANLAPSLFHRLIRAAVEDHHELVARLGQTMQSLHAIYDVGSRWTRCISNLKAAMAMRGLCEPTVAPPLLGCSLQEQETIGRRLGAVLGGVAAAGPHSALAGASARLSE